jgi:hypothetical protein
VSFFSKYQITRVLLFCVIWPFFFFFLYLKLHMMHVFNF